jgi:hypothetical protein
VAATDRSQEEISRLRGQAAEIQQRNGGPFATYETELAELLWTITVINAWNRLGAVARPWALSGDAKG